MGCKNCTKCRKKKLMKELLERYQQVDSIAQNEVALETVNSYIRQKEKELKEFF